MYSRIRSELYVGPDATWPSEGGNKDGVPRTISDFNGLIQDNVFNWPGNCME